jgi:8-oxo-dGTP pyrophosphatase MutT (NUDIX family)
VAETPRDAPEKPVVTARAREYECPFFAVVAKQVRYPGQARVRRFYSVEINDWTAVLAVDTAGRIPLVRQYRPVIERAELELPAGAVLDARPEAAARRELLEETGYEASEFVPLGCIFTEPGRLTSRAWLFFAPNARRVADPTPPADEPLELVLVTQTELHTLIENGAFASSGHVAAVGLALTRGMLPFPIPS